MSELLLGKPLADKIYQEILSEASALPTRPTLAAVGFSDDKWLQYVNSLCKSGDRCAINVENVIADGMTPEQFFRLVRDVSSRADVCGVLLQQPLPKQYAEAVSFVDTGKDVDCLNPLTVAKLYKGEQGFQPATPLAVLTLLDFYGVDLQGKNVVIVGRGNAVGKPLALMALQRNATVTVCHTKTVNLPQICRNADVLISACGAAGLITKDCVTSKTVVVDVGLSFVGGKTCGDVQQDVYDVCRCVSPVPGGVGPVTRAMLFSNLLKVKL